MTTSHEQQLVHSAAQPKEDPGIDGVRKLLRQVVDPEIGINIVDLGLVYRIDLAPDRLRIEMTMTSPACPMGDLIIDDAHAVLAGHLPVDCVPEIILVWDPPWAPSMMSEHSRKNLGW